MVLRFGNVLYEPLWNSAHHRPRADHRRRDARRRLARRLLRHLRRAARHGAEPHAAAPLPGRDGAARQLRRQRHPRREAEGAEGAEADRRRTTSTTVTVRGQYRAGAANGGAVPGYREEIGVEKSRTETFVALKAEIANWRWAGRALLPAHRQAPARARLGDRRRLQADPALDLPEGRRRDPGQPAGAPPAAGRGRQAVDHDQGSRPRRHAGAPRAARHELRRAPSRSATRTPTSGCSST